FYFFFQAEDGIRDATVTGVQTCALPIYNKIDVWSYYKDGKEVYREIDSTFTGKPDQYRWFNDGGAKWGVDETKDGKIKFWKVIEIGRASCREREEVWEGTGVVYKDEENR